MRITAAAAAAVRCCSCRWLKRDTGSFDPITRTTFTPMPNLPQHTCPLLLLLLLLLHLLLSKVAQA
jgi:hypothetical protein